MCENNCHTEYDSNYHIKQLDKQFRNLKDECEHRGEEIANLREIVNAINVKSGESEDTYYAWMPHEENHLETLSCPILIPANWLRKLVHDAYEKGREEAKAEYNSEPSSLRYKYELSVKMLTKEQSKNQRMKNENETLLECLRTFSEEGVKHDLNPTLMFNEDINQITRFYAQYIAGIDKYVREEAKNAIEKIFFKDAVL